MEKNNKMKKLFNKKKKHKKFIIIGIVFAILLVFVVFGLTFSLSKIMGNVYEIDNIADEIDNIQIGDEINYTANGYSNWQVLNINKEDNTVDIVSKTSVEDVTVQCRDSECTTFYETLQNAANKYLDGKYAVSARSIVEDDLQNVPVESGQYFWLYVKSAQKLYHGYFNYNYGDEKNLYNTYYDEFGNYSEYYGYIVPVVTIGVDDASNINVGDVYSYSLNNIDEWLVLYINDSKSISIVPKNLEAINLGDDDIGENISWFVNDEMDKYKNDTVLNVRSISNSDLEALNSINYGKSFEYNYFYTGSYHYSYSNQYKPSIYSYYNACLFYDTDADELISSNQTFNKCNYKYGFRPVITIKYSDEEKNGKNLKDELVLGDYVKYSANGYNNWKVLNIDKEKGTVDIISGGIVKNITLEGKDNYDNLDTILQEEVDKYKIGEYVVSARTISFEDFDNLRTIKDTLSVRYFFNNTLSYKNKGTYGNDENVMIHAVGVGYYDLSILDIDYGWASLESEKIDVDGWGPAAGAYRYTAGLRPIITLKLHDVFEKEDTSDIINNDNVMVEEQNKINQSVPEPVKNNDIKKDMIISSDNSVEQKDNSVVHDNNKVVSEKKCECDSKDNCVKTPKKSGKRNFVIGLIMFNMFLIISVIVLNIFGFGYLFKKIMKKKK